jgi:Ca2+-binding EF-hand superfamily protein
VGWRSHPVASVKVVKTSECRLPCSPATQERKDGKWARLRQRQAAKVLLPYEQAKRKGAAAAAAAAAGGSFAGKGAGRKMVNVKVHLAKVKRALRAMDTSEERRDLERDLEKCACEETRAAMLESYNFVTNSAMIKAFLDKFYQDPVSLADCAVLMKGRSERKGLHAKELMFDLKNNLVPSDGFDPVSESFELLDPEGDGCVTKKEMRGLLEVLTGTQISDADFELTFESADRDDDGSFGRKEYVFGLARSSPASAFRLRITQYSPQFRRLAIHSLAGTTPSTSPYWRGSTGHL